MKRSVKILLFLVVSLTGVKTFGQTVAASAAFKNEFLEDINRTREKGYNCGTTYMRPVPPIIWNDELAIAAFGHARDMSNQNYFSHTSKDGRDLGNRVSAVGYNYKGYRSFAIGENIAEGQQSIEEVMKGWFKSVGHCKNLMNPAFKEVGIAEYNSYWVQDFGGRDSFSAEQEKMIKSGKYRLIEKH